ncbi:MAG TPA: hypothetical protein VHR27_21485 [Blastocatellia bacterium]|nr:hypothetical protein [Blastocatellia bacterium]
MKPDSKNSKALVVGGIILASAFVITAIVRPKFLDWILHPSEERSDQIKKEMERQKGIGSDGQPDTRPGRAANSGALTPTPSPDETVLAGGGEIRIDERIPKPECISRDQVVKAIYASEEAKAGRVIWVSSAPDGGRIMVAYMKKTFLGIGSGENQIEGILRRGLRNSFPDRLIKSVKVRSDGKRSVQQGERNIKAEVLVIEPLKAGCRWPSASVESR